MRGRERPPRRLLGARRTSSASGPSDARRPRPSRPAPARGRRRRATSAPGPAVTRAVARRSRRRAVRSSSRSPPAGPGARCSRSAARAATRRSGSAPPRALPAATSRRSRPSPASSTASAENVADAGLDELGRGRARRRVRDARRASTGLRPRLPRRLEGRLRGAVRARRAPRRARAASSSPTTWSPTRETLAAYSAARQADPTLVSVTVPLDNGLEVTSVLTDGLLSD